MMKSRTRLQVGLIVLAAIALTACSADAGSSATDSSAALENTTWVLESYGEQDTLQAVLEGTEITGVFDSAEGNITGSAGCNSYFASYEISGNELSVPTLGYTEMYCLTPDGVMEQEQQYVTALASAERYEIREGRLHISGADGRALVFSATEP